MGQEALAVAVLGVGAGSVPPDDVQWIQEKARIISSVTVRHCSFAAVASFATQVFSRPQTEKRPG